MDKEDFKKILGVKELPDELENLILFASNLPDSNYYSAGFEICGEGKTGLQYGWCDKEDFLNKLIAFATANGSGSIYAIWINDNEKPLSQLPIAVFGDEGGVHIVAENILQLFHLLTFDVEISVDADNAFFHKDKNTYQKSKYLDNYLEWIKEKYHLEPVTESEKIIKIAQEKYKETFENWFKQYYPNSKVK
jgi:hypothetical protein